MNTETVLVDLIADLQLPAGARVDQRVPKKLLVENGAPTTADRRAINDGIEELGWVAALKPNTVGVPDYRDDTREYLEIAVLKLQLRPGAKTTRLIALTHRAVPYPVLLFATVSGSVTISAVHKRWSQSESNAIVLDGDIIEAQLSAASDPSVVSSFRSALAVSRQPSFSLFTLYRGWIDMLLAFQAGCKTGRFVLSDSPGSALARREALTACAKYEAEIIRLRSAAAREKQMSRQVALNLELKRIEAELNIAYGRL
jgi:hypothetical protein